MHHFMAMVCSLNRFWGVSLSLTRVLRWFSLVTIKLIIGINLLNYATRRMEGMERRAREDDAVNNYERPPIGEGEQEQVCIGCCYGV
jgi:hypothetical protein